MYHVRERRRERQDLSAYQFLIATPIDVASDSIVLPANGEIGVSFSTPVAAGDLTVTVGSRNLENPALDADVVHKLGYFERGRELSFVWSGDPATITVYVIDLDRKFEIGTGALT